MECVSCHTHRHVACPVFSLPLSPLDGGVCDVLRSGCWGNASHVIVTWHSPAAGDMKKVTRKEVGREGEREGRRTSGGEGERGREGGGREGGGKGALCEG